MSILQHPVFRVITESIRNKLMLSLSLVALVPLALLSIVAYELAVDSLETRILEHYASLGKSRADAVVAVRNKDVRLVEFAAHQNLVRDRLKQITDEKLDSPAARAELTGFLKELRTASPDFDTAGILDKNGQILVQTEEFTGAFANRDQSKNLYYTGAMATPGTTYSKPVYRSSTTGKVEQALSTTVLDDQGRVLGVLVVRLNLAALQNALSDTTGMGATGESFLVNSDKVMVSQARNVKEDTLLNQKVESEGVRRALELHESGQIIDRDYRGVEVLGTYTWVPDLKVAVICKTDVSEAFEPIAKLRWMIVGLLAGTAVLVFGIALWLSGGLTRQIRNLQGLFNEIGMGNFEARAAVTSADELGTVATSLNAMLDNTLALIQSREERDQIQAAIGKLLEEVSGVAEGDLTKEVEVTADVTGAIADSFNYMIEQLRKIIGRVQESTLEVSTSATQIHASAAHLAQGTEAQAAQIVNTSTAIEEMAASIQQVSDTAAQSAGVAQQALASAKQGSDLVQNTMQGMNRIRDQVQETAKRIKRLGESSQEIGQIIQLIDDIADRTSILALNASIQAAMAGDAGRGFAVVAEEVERLAVRSTDATKKIAGLVKAIQSETAEAVSAMEKGINEVVNGSKLSNQANHALGEIESVSKRLADLIQSISLASKQQARGSEAIAKSMNEISHITQQTAAGTKQAAVSVNDLASLADDLRDSVSMFRLPGHIGMGLANGSGRPLSDPNGHANRHSESKRSSKPDFALIDAK
jgi:methyl-accepting chemotaxis protein